MNQVVALKNTFQPIVTFRTILQEELVRRCRKNPGYSLRAFAKALKVEPSALSQIINGKRPITEKMKLRLGKHLGFTQEELKKIPVSADSEGIQTFETMTLDTFAMISDWYHFAILELTYVLDFQADPQWIAERLGVSEAECERAIDRLLRMGLLEKTSDGRLKDTSENGELSSLHPSMSSIAARNYQIQLLELSKRSVENDPLETRNHTSATFCFDTDDMPKAIEAITKFRRQFAKDFQPKNKANEVYQIQISFFPLTKNNNNKETL